MNAEGGGTYFHFCTGENYMRYHATLASLASAVLGMVPVVGHAADLEASAGPAYEATQQVEKQRVCRHPGQSHCWKTILEEDFEDTRLPALKWAADTYPDTMFSDNGSFFQKQGIAPPANAYRATASFGKHHWLTAESYSLSMATPFNSLLAITDDPSGARNKVLRLASPAHTDATVIRSTQPLPSKYRISLKVGFADFGDGKPGLNGYDGGESAGPWLTGWDANATVENGFYWLAILDSVPRPHNNVWIHHHRKVTLDSDNNVPTWMEIYNGTSFIANGEMPLMMFGVDGRGQASEYSGKPFIPYSAGAWQPSGTIRAVDSYKPMRWYHASIERDGNVFTMRVSGDFKYGGTRTYTAVIDAEEKCLWHYNQTPLAASSNCVDNSHYPSLPNDPALWPAGSAWPDYFMFGDPHNNFYEGKVYYDDIRMEVWRN